MTVDRIYTMLLYFHSFRKSDQLKISKDSIFDCEVLDDCNDEIIRYNKNQETSDNDKEMTRTRSLSM